MIIQSTSSGPIVPPSSEAGNEDSERKRKRGRTGYSCFECRRRKVKCDNVVPCNNCIGRGEGHLCRGPSMPGSPPAVSLHEIITNDIVSKQFRPASFSSVKQLLDRINSVEATLTERITSLESTLAAHGIPIPTSSQAQTSRATTAAAPGVHDDREINDSWATQQEDEHTEDTEVALDYLESAAFTDNAIHAHKWNLGSRLSMQRTSATEHGAESHDAAPFQNMTVEQALVTPWPSILDTRDSYRTWDIFFSSHDSSQRKLQETIILNIPPPYVLSALLAYFWSSIDTMWHVLHRPTFQAEVQQLQVYLWSNGVMPQLDPAWYALLFAVLGFSSSRISKDKKLGEVLGWTENTARQWQDQMFTGCRLAMTAADWIHKPSARILQTMLFLCAFEPHRGSLFGSTIMFGGRESSLQPAKGENPNAFHHWLSCAIRIGRQLRLDSLGSSPIAMPMDDPGWPQGDCSLKRELGIRLWRFLVVLDMKASKQEIEGSSYDTPLPARCRDEQLGLSLDFASVPDDECSDVDHLIYQSYMTKHLAKVRTFLSTSGSISPKMAAELDAELMHAMKHVTGSSNGILPTVASSVQHDSLQRYNLSASLHYRLLRLHRPFFLRSLRNCEKPTARQDKDDIFPPGARDPVGVCLTSAQAIISTYAWPALRGRDMMWWWFPAHVFSAAIVLLLHRLHSLRHGGTYRFRNYPPSVDSEVPGLLGQAQKTLEEAAAYSEGAIGSALTKSAHILSALRSAEAGWLATNASEPMPDLLIRVLKSVLDTLSHSVSLPEGPDRGTFAESSSTSQLSASNLIDPQEFDNLLRSTLDIPTQMTTNGEFAFADDFSAYLTDLILQPTSS